MINKILKNHLFLSEESSGQWSEQEQASDSVDQH